MKATFKLLTLVLTLVCSGGAASAATYFTGNLNSAQEVPTNSSTATGFGRVTLNDAETQITVSLTFSGLSSNQTASHIHSPAVVGVNAPIIFKPFFFARKFHLSDAPARNRFRSTRPCRAS